MQRSFNSESGREWRRSARRSRPALDRPVRLEIGSPASEARLAEGLPRWAFRVRDLAAEAESWERYLGLRYRLNRAGHHHD